MLKIRPFVSFRKIFRHAAWKKHENESMNPYISLNMLVLFCKRMDISFQQHESLIAISVLRLQHYSSGADQGKSAGGAHQPTHPKPPHPASLGWSAVFWYNKYNFWYYFKKKIKRNCLRHQWVTPFRLLKKIWIQPCTWPFNYFPQLFMLHALGELLNFCTNNYVRRKV